MPAPKRPRGRPKKVTPASPAPKPLPEKAKITARARLTSEQWDNMAREHVLNGVSLASLARRYDLTVKYVYAQLEPRVKIINAEAEKLALVKRDLDKINGPDRAIVEQLAERMASLAAAAAEGAQLGMEASAHLMRVAKKKAMKVDEDADEFTIRPLAAIAETANKLGTQGMAVMAAHAKKKEEAKTTASLEDLISGSWGG